MKKVLSLVLAVVMMLSCFSVAFAAPADVTDNNQVKAVDALISLGIVNGYEDGSYKPGNTVTRAEMAKLIVTALGHGDLAAGSTSSFKDAQGKWYDGFVGMASGLEIVTGYPDGTFKGENPVSYQEAIVMIMRALGYTNSSVNNGVNAYNASKYKAVGATLGLLKNVTFKSGGANRGDIAVMVYNALEVETVKINDKGLAEKIVAYTYEQPIAGTNKVKIVDVNEVLLDRLTDREDVTITPNSLDEKNKNYLGDLVDLTPYMYQNITVYLNDDGYVVFVKRSNSSTVSGTLYQVASTHSGYKANTLRILNEDGAYEYADFPTSATTTTTVDVYWNGGEMSTEQSLANINLALNYANVTAVLDSNDVVIGLVAEKATGEIKTTGEYKTNSVALGSILLPKNGTKVDLTKVTVTGDATAIEDIEKGDVVTAYAAAGATVVPEKVKLVVSRNVVEGKVSSYNDFTYAIVIDGNKYYTTDFSAYNPNAGDEGQFYLNHNGDIFAFVGKSMSNADYSLITLLKQGVSVGTDLIQNAKVRLLDKDGSSTTYEINSDATIEVEGATTIAKADIFADPDLQKFDATTNAILTEVTNKTGKYIVTGFEVNSNEEITHIRVKDLGARTPVDPTSKKFTTSDNVVIFETYLTVNRVATVDDLKQSSNSYYVDYDSNGDIALIVAHEQLINDGTYAVITAIENVSTSGGVLKQVTAYVKGEQVTYLASSSAVSNSIPSFGGSTVEGKVYNLSVSNDKINASFPAAESFVFETNTTTSSAITVVSLAKGIFDTNTNGRMVLADEASVYVYERNAANTRNVFSRVGDLTDLELLNSIVEIYDIDADGEVDVILVKVQR